MTTLLIGQRNSAAEADKASSLTQTVKRDFRFEVASIRETDPYAHSGGRPSPSGSDRYTTMNTTMAGLAFQAFGLKQRYEIEFPQWMNTTYFAINATLPEGATKADLPILIQHLLEDRFGLVFHRDVRRMKGYELVVAKSGPHLAKSAARTPDDSVAKGPSIEVKNGVPQFSKDAGSGKLMTRTNAIWRGRNRTMSSLAMDLADDLEAPVRDATGLDGEYDYTLTFSPKRDIGSAGGEDAPLAHPLLRDAMEEQLGLKLQPAGDIPINVIVLDNARKVPTEN